MIPLKRFFLEVAVESIEALKAAEEAGADRIELCAHLDEGGITPSGQFVSEAAACAGVPIRVMIRPRGGDFTYTKGEFQKMTTEISSIKQAGIEGVVFGVLLTDEDVDVTRTKALVDLARPMKSTFHRAFDSLKNPVESLDRVIATGVDTLLTSGGVLSAERGVERIAELVKKSNGRISILAGGGIRGANVADIVRRSGVHAVHVGGASASVEEIKERVAYVRRELGGL